MKYSNLQTPRDGRSMEIRVLRRANRVPMLAAVGRMSEQSRCLRFFGSKSGFAEDELAYYIAVDFVSQVALVTVLQGQGEGLIFCSAC